MQNRVEFRDNELYIDGESNGFLKFDEEKGIYILWLFSKGRKVAGGEDYFNDLEETKKTIIKDFENFLEAYPYD